MTTLKIGFALIGLSAAFSSTAFAENCRALPRGPEKRACVMRENPGMFEAREAKKERCKQLSTERGFTSALIDLTGGQIQVMFDLMPASIEYIRTGKQRALVTSMRFVI
jgi:hypothetical protein